jgi:hypothetical protein
MARGADDCSGESGEVTTGTTCTTCVNSRRIQVSVPRLQESALACKRKKVFLFYLQ